jgi:hypothetical protein
MSHHGKRLGLAALLALAVAAPSGTLRAEPEEQADPVLKELRELRQQVALLRKLNEVESRVTALELKQINERLMRIEERLARLTPSVTTRKASSFTPGTPLTTGTVRLANRLPVPASVTVNGVTYEVPPLATRVLPAQPAGALNYEVSAPGFYARTAVSSTLAANEALTIHINNPTPPGLILLP